MVSPREHLAAVFKQCVEDATESLMDKVVEARENDANWRKLIAAETAKYHTTSDSIDAVRAEKAVLVAAIDATEKELGPMRKKMRASHEYTSSVTQLVAKCKSSI